MIETEVEEAEASHHAKCLLVTGHAELVEERLQNFHSNQTQVDSAHSSVATVTANLVMSEVEELEVEDIEDFNLTEKKKPLAHAEGFFFYILRPPKLFQILRNRFAMVLGFSKVLAGFVS